MGRKKDCQNPFSAILRLKKNKNKVPVAIKLQGGGEGLNGQAISEGTFFCGFPKKYKIWDLQSENLQRSKIFQLESFNILFFYLM